MTFWLLFSLGYRRRRYTRNTEVDYTVFCCMGQSSCDLQIALCRQLRLNQSAVFNICLMLCYTRAMKIRVSVVSAVISMIGLIVAGTVVFHYLEDWTLAQSFYFSVATLATVGYGDITPTTDETRVVAALYILVGVGVFIAALTSISSRYLNNQEHQLSDNLTRRLRRSKSKRKR